MKTQKSTPLRDATSVEDNAVASDGQKSESVTQQFAKSAHNKIDKAAAKADELESHLRAEAVKVGTNLDASKDAATAQVESSLAKLEKFVKSRPIAAAGMAFAAGVLATALLRR